MHDAHDPQDIAKWEKWFGIECNNRAWALAESGTRTPGDDDEMLHCAHAAVHHWSKVGNEHNRALGAMLLGQVHALAGSGTLARRYAQEAFDYVMSRESPAWEVAFVHAILANAASATHEASLHAENYAKAAKLGAALPEEDRVVFDRTFRVIPRPAQEVPA